MRKNLLQIIPLYFQVIASKPIACNQTSLARDFFFSMPHIWIFFVSHTCMTHTSASWTWIIPELIFIRLINWYTFCPFRLEIYRIGSFSSSQSTKLSSDWIIPATNQNPELILTWVFIFRLLRLGSFCSLPPSFSKWSLLIIFLNLFFLTAQNIMLVTIWTAVNNF